MMMKKKWYIRLARWFGFCKCEHRCVREIYTAAGNEVVSSYLQCYDCRKNLGPIVGGRIRERVELVLRAEKAEKKIWGV